MTKSFRNILIGSLLLTAPGLGAVRANPNPRPVRQPDGTTVMTRLLGDEHFHYAVTEDLIPVMEGEDGFLYYAVADGDDALRPGSLRAADAALRTSSDMAWLQTNAPLGAIRGIIDRQSQPALKKARRQSERRRAATYPTLGNQRGLVILVEYKDVHFTVPDAHDEFERMLNEPGYSNLGGTGSARDWFIDNSMGQFTPEFDVYGPVRLANNRAYYGANKGGDDVRPEYMVIEACAQLDDEVDFTKYDCDNDGIIDNVFVFYAGYGENLGMEAGTECVWPHSYDIMEATSLPYIHDGVRLNHYACTNEIDLDNVMDGIGTFCHEFSHVMGLPDLYATNYSYAFTPGTWSVMDEGPYNNNSRTPPYYSAFERYSLGWLTPKELGAPANVKLASIDTNQACRISTAKENEYFLFENRQQKGWDTYIPHHGMLVWHIDYNENIWKYNTVNDRQSHQYVDIEEADGTQHESSVAGDCFPGIANVTSFTDDTTPSMRSWDGSAQGKPVTDIRESNGYIYFSVSGGKAKVDPVTALPAEEVHAEGFTARWTAAEEGCEYRLSVYTVADDGTGRPTVSYADGYRDLGTGAETSWKVTGLRPGTEYRYSVRAVDPFSSLESVASNEMIVTTLPPEFRHLSPEPEAPHAVGDTSFTARWKPVEGAATYLLSVYTKQFGASETETVDFTGGYSAMPQGWTSTSRQTYGSALYSGESAPSMRINVSGQYLESPVYGDEVRGLSFWHRGATASEGSLIRIYGGDGVQWSEIAVLDVDNAAGGTVWDSAQALAAWPSAVSAVRIVGELSDKGSIAIDDVTLYHGGEMTMDYASGYEERDTKGAVECRVEGLQPGCDYWFTVRGVAADGKRSALSKEGFVTTINNSGVDSAAADTRISVDGLTVRIASASGVYASLCDLWGRVVASGSDILVAPMPGVYVVRLGSRAVKVILK
ncbi:MAG: M6 family metalloprotease domain-containing protein [Muribaculaceae bacterium]|nr:M6 family metalloprotease domain-containing protein [Muribaculaceae bacterium]